MGKSTWRSYLDTIFWLAVVNFPVYSPDYVPHLFGQQAEACSVEEVGRPKEAIGSKEATGTMKAKGSEEGMGSEEGKWEFEEMMFWVHDEAPIVDVTEYTSPCW